MRIRRSLRANRRAQALIEVFFVTILFIFVGVMGYEGGVMYHNVDVIHNSLKQAVWVASMGAQDEDIMPIIADADTQLLRSVFFDHMASGFTITVWIPTPTGLQLYAPTSSDKFLTGGATDPSTGEISHAAYVWRAFNMNIRIGLNYKFGYYSPYFNAMPTNILNLPLSASQPITASNDNDFDGMVDLYEREVYSGLMGLAWTAMSHTDNINYASDAVNTDIDRDGVADNTEIGFGMYDYDNDGFLDNIDDNTNLLRNPRIGDSTPALVLPTS